MYFCPSPFTCWKYTFELLVTGMLCHSKVWSRVWTHRCNVNMNPYISVCPFSVCISYPSWSFSTVCPSCLSAFFFYLCSAFISGCTMSTSKGRLCCFTLFGRAVCLDLSWPSTIPMSSSHFCAFVSLPLSASVILIFTFLYSQEPCSLSGSLRCMRGTVFTVYSFFPVKQMSQNWLFWKIHCWRSLVFPFQIHNTHTVINKLFSKRWLKSTRNDKPPLKQWILCVSNPRPVFIMYVRKHTKIILFLFLLTLRWMFSCVFKSANLCVLGSGKSWE